MPEVIKLIRDTDRFFQYETSSTPTTEDELQAYLKNTHAVVENLVDAYLWQPSTSYTLGQIVRSANMPAGKSAKCTQAGTSDVNEPAWTSNSTTFTDGSCKWNLVTATINSITATGHVTGTASIDDSGTASIALSLANVVNAGDVGSSSNATATSFTVPYFHVDAKGRVTSYGVRTVTITSAATIKIQHDASPNFAISPSMGANFSTGQKITTFNVKSANIAAGTHSIASLIKSLIKRAHSHGKVTIKGSDCNCNCDCNCDCGDDTSG